MKTTLVELLEAAAATIPALADIELPTPQVERARDQQHGDFASNFAMQLAKPARNNPRALAQMLIDALPSHPGLDRVEIAGPGFINFYLIADIGFAGVEQALKLADAYGRATKVSNPRILVEFVSANPTGPLHVGHGRLAAYGDSLARLLGAAGYPVKKEYYVNDAGRQMEILALSVLVRKLQKTTPELTMPSGGYQGDYIIDIANSLPGDLATITPENLLSNVVIDDSDADKDRYLDALISNAQDAMGTEVFSQLRRFALNSILAGIREDMTDFGAEPDVWFSEESLSTDGSIDQALSRVDERGFLYKRDGATWFKASELGDEKDRVVIRDNGKKTYFSSDIAYHYNKRERGFDLLLDVLGSDHHGYIARVRAGLEAMGYEGASLEVELVQFVTLYRAGKKAQMGTRSGNFVTLRQLCEEVGNDAARFFYVMRSNDQHLDFDLDLATSKANENPVYYVQYAHARVASVFRRLEEKGFAFDLDTGLNAVSKLSEDQERLLAADVARYPEIIQRAAKARAPHHLVNFLRETSTHFHSLYNAHDFIVDDAELRNARLALIRAAGIVIANGLELLGVSAPESM